MGSSFLKLENVSKRYPGYNVISGVNCTLESPGLYLILGANGSGKSTLLKICSGTISPDGGSVTYGPSNPTTRSFQHESGLYSELSVFENLDFFRGIFGLPKNELSQAMVYWGLSDIEDRLVSDLSKGQTARVALARTFMGDADIYLLDEPSAALDDIFTEKLRSMISIKKSTSLILVSTHDLARFEGLFLYAAVIVDSSLSAMQSFVEAKQSYIRGNR